MELFQITKKFGFTRSLSYINDMEKIIINRVLNLDGSWQGYKLTPTHAYVKPTWPNPGKQFNTLNEIIKFYQLQNVRELGVKYSYDNKDRKYGIESYEAIYS